MCNMTIVHMITFLTDDQVVKSNIDKYFTSHMCLVIFCFADRRDCEDTSLQDISFSLPQSGKYQFLRTPL